MKKKPQNNPQPVTAIAAQSSALPEVSSCLNMNFFLPTVATYLLWAGYQIVGVLCLSNIVGLLTYNMKHLEI